MATYRDFDYPIRINGDLTIPSSNLTVGGTVSIGGANPSITLTGTSHIAYALSTSGRLWKSGSAGSFSSNSVLGDIGLRHDSTAGNIHFGLGTGVSAFRILSGDIVRTKNNILDDGSGDMTFTQDDKGLWFSNGNGGRIYKKSGSGIKIQAHLDTVGVAITKADGTDMFVVKTDGTGLTYNGQTLYHAGNLTINDSTYVKNNVTGQTVETGFTIKGTNNIGNNGNVGVVSVKDSSGNQVIRLDGVRTGAAPSSPNVSMDGDGNATFKGIVSLGTITTPNTARVDNLNAQYIDGKGITALAGTESIYDIHGAGVYTGVDVIETAVPSASIRVTGGTVYTSSGRRIVFAGTEQKAIATPSASFYRYDIVFIHGPSSGTNEGSIGIVAGTAVANTAITAVPPSRAPKGSAPTTYQYPYDAIVLAKMSIKPIGQYSGGNATILNADIDNTIKEWMPFLFNGLDFKVGSSLTPINLTVNGSIMESGKLLTDKYTQLGTLALPVNNAFYGRQIIRSTGSVSGTPTSGNYYLKITDGTANMLIDPNEITTDDSLYLQAVGKNIYLNTGDTYVNSTGLINATRNGTTMIFAIGETSKRWRHDYGGPRYSIAMSSNSFQRHVRWTGKQDNYVDIELDNPATEEVQVDIILIGNTRVWGSS